MTGGGNCMLAPIGLLAQRQSLAVFGHGLRQRVVPGQQDATIVERRGLPTAVVGSGKTLRGLAIAGQGHSGAASIFVVQRAEKRHETRCAVISGRGRNGVEQGQWPGLLHIIAIADEGHQGIAQSRQQLLAPFAHDSGQLLPIADNMIRFAAARILGCLQPSRGDAGVDEREQRLGPFGSGPRQLVRDDSGRQQQGREQHDETTCHGDLLPLVGPVTRRQDERRSAER